jgi:DNA-binding transcriptional LysR family regulator
MGPTALRPIDKPNMLELRHLRYFVAVAENLNFSRAAEQLHMAQPPLSVAIRQLEQAVGVALLRRTTREVALTEAGRAFLDDARRTLSLVDKSVTEARRIACGELGQLRVGYGSATRFGTLPAVGKAFRKSRPDVVVVVEEMWNARMPEALVSGGVDVALACCPEIHTALSYAPIRREGIVALVAHGHPMAGRGAISLVELENEEFLCAPRAEAPRYNDILVGLCHEAGFDPVLSRHSLQTDWDVGIFAQTGAVSIAPESLEHHLPDGVVALRLTDSTASLDTAVLWRTLDPPPAVHAFVDVARAAFSESRLAERPLRRLATASS